MSGAINQNADGDAGRKDGQQGEKVGSVPNADADRNALQRKFVLFVAIDTFLHLMHAHSCR